MTDASQPPTSGDVAIRVESDIVLARRAVRDAAIRFGLPSSDVTRVVTAASELARNIHRYAGHGTMHWSKVERNSGVGLELRFIDRGPGIENLTLALSEGFTTGGGLGMGLPGSERLVDEMEIESAVGEGTKVTIRKWRKN